MVLFIEMADMGSGSVDPKERKGVSAENRDKKKLNAYDCDSSWDWGGKAKEKGLFSHRKGNAHYCNVVFVDGHGAAIPDPDDTKLDVEDESDPVEWNGHKRDKVYKSMGGGFY